MAETASPKPGDGDLKLLKAMSKLIGVEGIFPKGGCAKDKDEDRQRRCHHVLQPAGG